MMQHRREKRKRMTKQQAEHMGLLPERRILYEVVRGLPGIPQSRSIDRRMGRVVDMWPYHFVVQWENADYKECFFYELLLGLEEERIKIIQ